MINLNRDVHQWEDNLRHMSPEEFATSLLSSPLLSENSESNVDKSNGKAIHKIIVYHLIIVYCRRRNKTINYTNSII